MQSGGVEGVMRKESMRVVIDERKLKRKREHNNKPRKKPLDFARCCSLACC